MCLIRILIIAAAFLAGTAHAQNAELAELARQDQAVRTSNADDPSSDDVRRRRVLELIAEGAVVTPKDKLHAGLVLQHTPLDFCGGELVSISAENYLLAHHLFKQALAGGEKEAAYLVAASIDRYLAFTEGTQRYGTNRVIDQASGKEFLVPVDRSITDEERAQYGVSPLAELLEQWPEKPAPAAPGND